MQLLGGLLFLDNLPLDVALEGDGPGSVNLVRLLLEYGADPEKQRSMLLGISPSGTVRDHAEQVPPPSPPPHLLLANHMVSPRQAPSVGTHHFNLN